MHDCHNRVRDQHHSGFSRPVTWIGDQRKLSLMIVPAYLEASGRRVGYVPDIAWLKYLVSDSEKSYIALGGLIRIR